MRNRKTILKEICIMSNPGYLSYTLRYYLNCQENFGKFESKELIAEINKTLSTLLLGYWLQYFITIIVIIIKYSF